MRVSELSRRSGLPTATIKYYVRVGLLPEGDRTGYNQTDYSEEHLRRLRLVRALAEVGGLSIDAILNVLRAVDDDQVQMHEVLGTAQRSILEPDRTATADSVAVVERAISEYGWDVSPDNPGILIAAQTLDAFDDLDRADLKASLQEYLPALDAVAHSDRRRVGDTQGRQAAAETVIVGTVLGDRLLAGLRRIAQEGVSRATYPAEQPTSDESEVHAP